METSIAYGEAGVQQTLNLMAVLIQQGEKSPVVIQAARAVAAYAPRQMVQQAMVLRAWLARRWRFVADPLTVEVLAPADAIVAGLVNDGQYAGDCDEAAIVAGAMARAIGFPVQLVALAFPPDNQFAHVFAVATDPESGRLIEFDITRPSNRSAAEATDTLVLDVS